MMPVGGDAVAMATKFGYPLFCYTVRYVIMAQKAVKLHKSCPELNSNMLQLLQDVHSFSDFKNFNPQAYVGLAVDNRAGLSN